MPTLTTAVIEAAIEGFEAQKQHIDAQIAQLRGMLSSAANGAPKGTRPVRGRRKMSAAGRQAIAEAQRKRWAAEKQGGALGTTKKPKRRLSAAGRANIIAALKKRWAAKKAEGGGRAGRRKAA